MARQSLGLSNELYDYLLSVSLRESAVMQRLRARTAEMQQSNKQVSPDEGQLLAFLARLIGARKTIEVGVFTGYSALWVAEALPEDGQIIACDVDPETTAIARRYWEEAGVTHKIDMRLGPAVDTLSGLVAGGQAGQFDMAFIDADKSNYEKYFEQCLELVRPHGLIVIDNVLWYGRVIDDQDNTADTVAIRSFNERRLHDSRVDLSLIPVGDGMTLAVKR